MFVQINKNVFQLTKKIPDFKVVNNFFSSLPKDCLDLKNCSSNFCLELYIYIMLLNQWTLDTCACLRSVYTLLAPTSAKGSVG